MRGINGWYQVSIGGRWRVNGGESGGSDSRSALQADLAPGDEQTVEPDVVARPIPGVYLLEVDLVQEGVAWFQDNGTSPARATVRVGVPRRAGAATLRP